MNTKEAILKLRRHVCKTHQIEDAQSQVVQYTYEKIILLLFLYIDFNSKSQNCIGKLHVIKCLLKENHAPSLCSQKVRAWAWYGMVSIGCPRSLRLHLYLLA